MTNTHSMDNGSYDAQFERLVSCFHTVFSTLDRSAIPHATPDTVAGWDSVAHVTLLSLVGEEFGIDIDFDEFEEAVSFASILERVRLATA